MDLNEELLRKIGVTEISYENNANIGYYDDCGCVTNEPMFKLSLELDRDRLDAFQSTLAELNKNSNFKTDEMELKNELLTMHKVNECPGLNISEKIDNYLSKDLDEFVSVGEQSTCECEIITRYKIKHR